jgi:transposase
MPSYTDFQKGQIVTYHDCGWSWRQIAAKLGLSRQGIRDFYKRYEAIGSPANKKRLGRPRVLNERDKRRLRSILKSDRRQTLRDITNETNSSITKARPVSERTVQRYVHEIGYYARAGVRKPFVNEKNRKKRLAFVKEHWKKPNDYWKNWVMSDESRFTIWGSDGPATVWRLPHEKFDVGCMIPTTKHGGKGIMVWSCFCWKRLGPLVLVEGNMDSAKYQTILQQHLLPFLEDLRKSGYEPVFQEDNAPCHVSQSSCAWKEKHGIRTVAWPPYSPDINPIEHLWDELERRIRKRSGAFSNTNSLFEVAQEEWCSIEPEVWRKLILSMQRRLAAVKEAKGYPSKY